MRYNSELVQRYKYELTFIIFIVAISFVVILINEIMSTKEENLSNYFWMPSSIMQSVAAIYAVFIAILVLSIQTNQNIVSSIGDILKPRFKISTFVVAFTIYFNGLVLFIFSHYKPVQLEVNILYFASLISLFASLVIIIYTSFWMISAVTGLNTHDETLHNLSNGIGVEACYLALGTDINKWKIKSPDEKLRAIQLYMKLLEYGTPAIINDVLNFLILIKKENPAITTILNLGLMDSKYKKITIQAFGFLGDKDDIEFLEQLAKITTNKENLQSIKKAIDRIKARNLI